VLNIAVANDSKASGLKDGVVADYVSAVATQVTRDFEPAWNMRASLRFIPTGHQVPPRCAVIHVAGTSDEPGALGYHTETREGFPVGYIFARDDKKFGANPGITFSHEVLEMVLDPKIADTVFHRGPHGDEFHAQEACDAVEADELGYAVTLTGGTQILVSDFVMPDYFDDSARGRHGARYDFMGRLSEPFSLAPGGYQSVYVPGKGWTQRTAQKSHADLVAAKGPVSRMALRVAKSDAGAEIPEVAEVAEQARTLFSLGPA
jgi:hypothetical protein